jgi:hypothetical protein
VEGRDSCWAVQACEEDVTLNKRSLGSFCCALVTDKWPVRPGVTVGVRCNRHLNC